MKTLDLMVAMILVVIVLIVSSCSKNEALAPIPAIDNAKVGNLPETAVAQDMNRARIDPSIATITFNSIQPGVGGKTEPTSGGQSTSCGVFLPGKCVINVAGRSENQLLLRIQTGDGTPFKYNGILAIKSGSVCGEVINQIAIPAASYGQDISVKINNPGITKLYAVLVLNANQFRYYSNPVTVDATESLPVTVVAKDLTYLPRHGVFGNVAGINVYSNGPTYDYFEKDRSTVNGVDVGSKWQCIELVKRYYFTKYGIRIASVTYAKELYGVAAKSGLKAYPNGGSEGPRAGDIVVMDAQPKLIPGHTAIVAKVTANYIEIVQQNVYRDKHLNYRIPRNGNTVSNAMGYPVIGWLR